MRILCGTILAAMVALSAAGEDFAQWVDPFVGTVGEGNECFEHFGHVFSVGRHR